MAGDRRDSRGADYRVARIALALGLGLAMIVMLVADIVSPEYEVSPLILTILGAVVLTLLGLEARDILRGGG